MENDQRARETLDLADEACVRIRDESRHSSLAGPEYRHGFSAGANGCILAIRKLSSAALASQPGASDGEGEGDLATNAERMAWVFEQAEIWTPNADTTRMNGPAVAATIRALVAALTAKQSPADVAEDARCRLVAEFPGGNSPDDPALIMAGAIRALEKALTPSQPAVHIGREEIARIIDPDAFADTGYIVPVSRIEAALNKAAAILRAGGEGV